MSPPTTLKPTLGDGVGSEPALRVLLVEDDPADRDAVLAELERASVAVVSDWARTVDEAIERLDRQAYDLVLTDDRVGGRPSTEVMAEVRRRGLTCPVIVVTGSLDEELADMCLREGAIDFVVKGRLSRLPHAVRRAAEESRRRREHADALARLRMLSVAVDQGPATVVITDTLGRIEYVNRRFTEITGYTAEEAIGQTPRLVKSGRTPRETYEKLWSTISAGRVWRGEILNRRKNGDLYWCEVSISPIRGPDGVVSRFVAVHEDVTERRWAEQAIHEREERLRQIAENIREVFFVVTADFSETLYISPAYERVWGRSCRSLYENPASFMEAVHAEDRPRLLAHVTGTRLGEDTGAIEFRVVHEDGAERWVRASAAPVRDERGEVYRISGVALDVTAERRIQSQLQEREERYRKLVDASFDGVVLSVEGTMHEVSGSFANAIGYEPVELVGRPILDIVAPESRDEALRRIGGSIEGRYEVTLAHKDGRRILMEATARTHQVEGRVGRLTALRDVTEKRALEDQFRQAQKLEAVGRLAGGVAHDFNNLLTVILSEVQLLRLSEHPDPNAVGEALREIEDATKRAAALTRQLLTFSRRDVVQPVVLEPVEVVDGLRKMVQRVIGEDIRLDVVVGSAVGRVRIDRGHLEQVIVNLVVNARDAMPEGGDLRLELFETDVDETYSATHVSGGPGRYVVIAVSDTGIGMSKEIQAKLFEPFFTTKPAGKGTGLGLATSFGIVTEAGGHIGVYSEPGLGTTMKVYLPCVEAGSASVAETPSVELPRALTGTVLVVEDDAAVRRAAVRILEGLGCRVLQADDASTALELVGARGERPDVLFTDIVMPGMQGPDLAARMAELAPGIRVLFATGYTSDMAFRHGLLPERAAILSKPYTPAELSRKVKEALSAG